MARGQVAARTEGDVFQGRFFWYQACGLVLEHTKIQRVTLEHDDVSGVDDVAVFYEPPGVDAGGWFSEADFYQCKYHVDQRDAYSSEGMIDPDFIRAKTSLLQRFYAGYLDAREAHDEFRLYLISNWMWNKDDPLAAAILADGSLPESFFTAGPRSKLGQVREKWRAHLDIDLDQFADFARRLHFDLNYFGRKALQRALNDRLAYAGLRPIPADKRSSPYDSLVQQFLPDKTNSFDSKAFAELCDTEGLWADVPARQDSPPSVLGIRSYMRGAERLEDEAQDFVCVAEYFDGRQIQEGKDWQEDVIPEFSGFLRQDELLSRLRSNEHHLLLECNGSLALAAGYELDRKSGAQIYPIQKWPARTPWRPTPGAEKDAAWGWEPLVNELDEESRELAVAMSVSNDIGKDVSDYLEASDLSVQSLSVFRPLTGVGHSAITGADHASYLAERLVQRLSKLRRDAGADLVHLFTSAPNTLLFFLGQHRTALGPLQLYEYDFEKRCDGSYAPSIRLPQDLNR